MQRTNIFLTDEQQRRLDRRAKEQGVSKSGLIRIILDEALDITQASAKPEQAIEATSGIWSDRDNAELDDVLRWRQEAPLHRLSQ
jgi:metal-responsive CopG/Arc/MetJ family transcriptional regulator